MSYLSLDRQLAHVSKTRDENKKKTSNFRFIYREKREGKTGRSFLKKNTTGTGSVKLWAESRSPQSSLKTVRKSRAALYGKAYSKLNLFPKSLCNYKQREWNSTSVKWGGWISALAQKTRMLWVIIKLGLSQGRWHKTTVGATEIKPVFHRDHNSVGPHASEENTSFSLS